MGLLDAARTVTKVPAQDLARARRFYRDQLGLEPVEEREGGLRYVCGTTEFHLFASAGAASGRSTQLGFEVEDLDAVVAELRGRGLKLATFDLGGLEVVDQVVTVSGNYPSKGTGERGAFFRDSEGNLLALGQATGPAARLRRAARALLTDPDGRMLLVRIRDEVPVDADDPVTEYWSLVGGEVEAGESFEDAVRREITEETGHRVTATGPCIWWRCKTVVGPDGVRLQADERYFWCSLPDATLDHGGLTEHERRLDLAFRWWDLDDPALQRVRIFPGELVPAARAVLRDGRPPEPVEIR